MSSHPTPSEIIQLTKELRQLNGHRFIRTQNSIWRMMGASLLRGLAFGLGSVLGASLLVSGLVWWLSQFEFLPIIGDWVGQVVDQIKSSR